MQDNQIGPNIEELEPTYMARLPPSTITKNVLVV
jgi:hypothetical protein